MKIALVTLAALAAGSTLPRTSRQQEPPLQLELRIDDKTHRLTAGEKIEVKIGETTHKVVVNVSPYRRLKAAGIEFDYPTNTSFEYEEVTSSGDLKLWSLEGADLTVLVFQFALGEPDEMAELMANESGRPEDSPKATPEKIRVGGNQLQAFKAIFMNDTIPFCTTAFGVSAAGKTCVVVLQDSLSDDGKPSAEAVAMRQLLNKTFEIRRK